jgi:hypothetical protein
MSRQVTPLLNSRRVEQSTDQIDHQDIVINGDCDKENGGQWENSHRKYPVNNGNSNNTLETYGIVSLKESKIDAWSNKHNGCSRNGAVSDRLKLTLPLESNNRKSSASKQQDQPRRAWAEVAYSSSSNE